MEPSRVLASPGEPCGNASGVARGCAGGCVACMIEARQGFPRLDALTAAHVQPSQLVNLSIWRQPGTKAHAAAAGRGSGQEGEPAETRLGLARMNALLLEAFSAYAAILHAGQRELCRRSAWGGLVWISCRAWYRRC